MTRLLLASLIALLAVDARAATTDLIVRYREPQNTRAMAAFNTLRMGVSLNAQVDLINSEEGVVKLSFPSLEDARAARERLAASDAILNVAPNLTYRPAISYRLKPVAPVAEPHFFALPKFLGLGAIPDVDLPPAQVTPGADPLAAQDWAMANIRMEPNSRLRVTRPLIAAVIDTGVDYNHEDLIGTMWRKQGTNGREVGYDTVHDHAKPFDNVHFDVEGCLKDFACRLGLDTSKYLVNPGHGTHCAGHVAAVANNSLGIRGVGAGAKLMALKFFYDVGEEKAGQGDDAAAIQAIDYAVKNGARIISASWGGRIKREEAERSELKQSLVRARNAGVLVVIAAGNDGIDQEAVDDPGYPAAYELDNLIVVAASDKNDALADFSNYGGKTVHIAAPGVKILSTTVGSQYSDTVAKFTDSEGKEHQLDWDGTSMATPIVAGAAALVWSKYPNADYREIRDRILKGARKVPALAGKVTTGGVLDVAAALR
jgi:subtilisin family serine protease